MLRELAIELLAADSGFDCLAHLDLAAPFAIAPHHHEGVLQLDLIHGCRGRVFSGNTWLRFDGPLLLSASPRQTHGYELEPTNAHASVYHFKLPAHRELAIVRDQELPAAASPQLYEEALFHLAREATNAAHTPKSPPFRAICAILSMLALWPERGATPAAGGQDAGIDPIVEEATSLIEATLGEQPSVDDIAEQVGVSARHLSRLFVRALGVTPGRYAASRRLAMAKTRLLAGDTPVADIAAELGFSSAATFSRWFRAETNTTATAFRSDPHVF